MIKRYYFKPYVDVNKSLFQHIRMITSTFINMLSPIWSDTSSLNAFSDASVFARTMTSAPAFNNACTMLFPIPYKIQRMSTKHTECHRHTKDVNDPQVMSMANKECHSHKEMTSTHNSYQRHTECSSTNNTLV